MTQCLLAFLTGLLLLSSFNVAAAPIVELEIRDHLFYPAELVIPVDTKVKVQITNHDPTSEEV